MWLALGGDANLVVEVVTVRVITAAAIAAIIAISHVTGSAATIATHLAYYTWPVYRQYSLCL